MREGMCLTSSWVKGTPLLPPSRIFLFEPNPQVVKYSLRVRAAKFPEAKVVPAGHLG